LRSLLIDLDPQANLTASAGLDFVLAEDSTAALLGRATTIDSIIQQIGPDLAVVPSHLDLAAAEVAAQQTMSRETILKSALAAGSDWDFVLIDCPPSLGLLTVNALAASRWVLVPVQMARLPLLGLDHLRGLIEAVRHHLNPELALIGVSPTFFDSRRTYDRQMLEEVRTALEEVVLDPPIRQTVKVLEAQESGRTLLDYAGKSELAETYRVLASTILDRAGVEAHAA
jgi:chromosome partitioning protein